MKRFEIGLVHIWTALGAGLGLMVIAVAGFSLMYGGKIYPGVHLDGVYVGGLTPAAATTALQTDVGTFTTQQLAVTYPGGSLTIPVKALGVSYNMAATTTALDYGRQGNLFSQLLQRLRSLLNRPTTVANYSYPDANVQSYVTAADNTITQPVANAALNFSNGQVQVAPAQPGQRLDDGELIMAIDRDLATTSTASIAAPVYFVAPTVDAAALATIIPKASTYVAAPLTITVAGTTQTVDQSTILSWIDTAASVSMTDVDQNSLTQFYPAPTNTGVSLGLSQAKLGAYVANLANSVDQTPQNAVLSMQNGNLTVVQASQPGTALDQTQAMQQITTALDQSGSDRSVALTVASKPAAVNETNLASLGITTLLSSGQTTFPGSSTDRIINVTVGAAKFNNVLLSPGQEFSFGQILGPVGAAQGYEPGLVILGNEETDQYGGGLCQVATTAFRAALLAGLPINERSNHSYAVGFYTAPYGVPGVDATIYYPQVDLKFTNDTGHYILIQTSISGDSLTFNFYGTKTKTGVIIPPHFVYGTTDATKASETVFQRQILDLSGNVIKTDTFTQYYQPSTDFPIVATSNGA